MCDTSDGTCFTPVADCLDHGGTSGLSLWLCGMRPLTCCVGVAPQTVMETGNAAPTISATHLLAPAIPTVVLA